MSLKGGVDVSPKRKTEYLNAVEDVQKGKKGASERLAKFVDSGMISAEAYEELIEQHGIKKEKKSRNMKDVFFAIVAVLILFISMLCGLAFLIERYGKGIVVWYIFLWIWALSYACSAGTKR